MKKEYITPEVEIVEMLVEYGVLKAVSGNVTVEGDEGDEGDDKVDVNDDPMNEQVP